MKTLGYYNGKYDEIENMYIPMNDRGCYFGDGIYEVAVCKNGKIFALEDHLDRCFSSAEKLRINIPQTRNELTSILKEMVTKVEGSELILYWQYTRGTAKRSHVFPSDMKANLWIYINPASGAGILRDIRLMTCEDIRFTRCDIKTINLIPAVMYSTEAAENDCTEAVLHRNGRVTECAHSNIHILKDGVLITPPADNFILPGVTRKRLIDLCRRLGVPVSEQPFTLNDMMNADEVLVTSTTKFVVAAKEIDNKPVGGKDRALYEKLKGALYAEYEEETK